MIKLVNIWRHFQTITRHRHLVCRHCFKLGLYRQGLLHDLSKYSPEAIREQAEGWAIG